MGKNIQIAKKQVRSVEALEVKTDIENQTLEFSFSSETPYKRWYGYEIISHEKGAVNLDRLKAGAPFLFNHDWDKHLGVVENAWIGDDKRGYVKVKFSKSAFAQEKFQDIQDGILKGVSYGYMIEEMKLTKTSDDGDDEYTVTKSFPYEITACTVPADYSVGFGRSAADDEGEQLEVESSKDADPADLPPVQETNPIPVQEINNPAVRTAFQGGKMSDEHEKAKAAEKLRIQTIKALGEKFNKKDLAESLINGDRSIEEARGAFLEAIGMVQKPANNNEGEIGLSEKEKKSFSFVRAIAALVNPTDAAIQEAAKFERECSDAAAKLAGKSARGIMIPVEMLRYGKRDLVVGTSTAGGHLVETSLLAGSFIDLLRKKSVLQRAGAQVLNGLMGNIAIPRQTGAATAYWVGEGSAPTESQQAFDQVAMTPKTVGAFTDFSRKMILQPSVDVESMVRSDLAQVLALEIDRAGLYGSGTANQPLGLTGLTGLNIVDFAGVDPTFGEIVDMETAISADNADVEVMKYLINASTRGYLKKTPIVSGHPAMIMGADGLLNGYNKEVSNQIAAGDIVFGNFNDLIIGFWSGLDLMIDPYAGATSGNVRVIAHQDVDVAGRHGESFCRGYQVLP